MEIELRFFATFREAAGQKTITRAYEEDELTVGDVLERLESEFDGMEGALLDDGEIQEMLSVLKNGRGVVHIDGAQTVLEDGDTLSVFPPVAGG